jgi:membrane protein DedA with SNARE-associated domain
VFDSLLDVISSSDWTYGVVFLFAFLDAIIPIVPSETAVIAAGVLAASGDLQIGVVIVAAAVGAILGDNTAYLLGRLCEGKVRATLFRGGRRRHLDRAERALGDRGGYLIVIGRFIPGGRTAVTFSCGILRYVWRRFVVFDVVAGFIWASYAGLIGYFGGKAFEENPARGILLALGVAFGVAAAVELARWRKRRRALRAAPASEPATGDGVDPR